MVTDKQRKPRLLVVDNEPQMIEAIIHSLHSRVEIIGATDYRTAINHLVDRACDAVMAEVSMMVPDGRPFVLWLAETMPGWLPRLIVTSGGLGQHTLLRLQLAHPCPLLCKPFDPDLLEIEVSRIAVKKTACAV